MYQLSTNRHYILPPPPPPPSLINTLFSHRAPLETTLLANNFVVRRVLLLHFSKNHHTLNTYYLTRARANSTLVVFSLTNKFFQTKCFSIPRANSTRRVVFLPCVSSRRTAKREVVRLFFVSPAPRHRATRRFPLQFR